MPFRNNYVQEVRYDAVPRMAKSGEWSGCTVRRDAMDGKEWRMYQMYGPHSCAKKTLGGYLYESHGLVPIEI